MVESLLQRQRDTKDDATIHIQDNSTTIHKRNSILLPTAGIDVTITTQQNQFSDNRAPSDIQGNGIPNAWIPKTLQHHQTKPLKFETYNSLSMDYTDSSNNALPEYLKRSRTSTHLGTNHPSRSTPIHCKAWLRNKQPWRLVRLGNWATDIFLFYPPSSCCLYPP